MINTLLIVYICIQGNFSKLVNYLNPKQREYYKRNLYLNFCEKPIDFKNEMELTRTWIRFSFFTLWIYKLT